MTGRAQYRFSHRADGRYYWWGPRVDSRSELVSCSVEWFWSRR